jgi:hypothetical protein
MEQKKMNPEVKKEWVAALRSGEYSQCRCRLTQVGSGGATSHCCLGVLTELAVKAGVVSKGAVSDDASQMYGVFREVVYLPSEVAEWSGLNDAGLVYDNVGEIISLAHLNDSGRDFIQIADLIEQHA